MMLSIKINQSVTYIMTFDILSTVVNGFYTLLSDPHWLHIDMTDAVTDFDLS